MFCPRPNFVDNYDGFYISYNAIDIGVYECDTTALVIGQMEKFYILNGDHRKDYARFAERGLDACLDYFRANMESRVNKRSDKLAA